MAKVIIEFDRDEEARDIQVALDGWKYKHFIWELDQKLRSVTKYGAALTGNGEATESEREDKKKSLLPEVKKKRSSK